MIHGNIQRDYREQMRLINEKHTVKGDNSTNRLLRDNWKVCEEIIIY